MMQTVETVEFRLRNVPDDLFIELKVIATRERKTMNEKLIELIRKEVERKTDGKS